MELRLLHVHGVGNRFEILCYIYYKVSEGYPRMNPSLLDCVLFATFASFYVFANEQPVDGSSGSSHKVNTNQDVTKMICILHVSVQIADKFVTGQLYIR